MQHNGALIRRIYEDAAPLKVTKYYTWHWNRRISEMYPTIPLVL